MKLLEKELSTKDVQLRLALDMFTFIPFMIPIQNRPEMPIGRRSGPDW